MFDPNRLLYILLVYLCLPYMSDDVNCNINETLRNNIGTIIHDFDKDDRGIIRSIENLTKKITNARYAVIFNETCISYLVDKIQKSYVSCYN